MSDIVTSLWFHGNAAEAVDFYTGLLPDAQVEKVIKAAADGPGGPVGTIVQIDFTLLGRPFSAINGTADFPFTDAVSLAIITDTQAEADGYWAALVADGTPIACGWLADRYGLRWQICPRPALDLLTHPDPQVARWATEAMYTMTRLDSVEMARAAGLS
jgi:predicted 3-demethylubiquinone-9 3-methyltransferase (glyoxalase superfamily)